MITFEEAYEIARSKIKEPLSLNVAFDGSNHWFFGITNTTPGSVTAGLTSIAVNKETGEISCPIPSVPYYLSGEDPLPEEIEIKNARKIRL